MSRSDYPPGYDESRGSLYAPQGGGYPPPPAYGFPGFGGPQPGQPSAPYPAGPNTPMFPGQPGGYPGQPGGYPAGPYPGQAQPGGPPGAGYPMPPPIMPPMHIPSDIMSSGKTGTAEHEQILRLLLKLKKRKLSIKSKIYSGNRLLYFLMI